MKTEIVKHTYYPTNLLNNGNRVFIFNVEYITNAVSNARSKIKYKYSIARYINWRMKWKQNTNKQKTYLNQRN